MSVFKTPAWFYWRVSVGGEGVRTVNTPSFQTKLQSTRLTSQRVKFNSTIRLTFSEFPTAQPQKEQNRGASKSQHRLQSQPVADFLSREIRSTIPAPQTAANVNEDASKEPNPMPGLNSRLQDHLCCHIGYAAKLRLRRTQ